MLTKLGRRYLSARSQYRYHFVQGKLGESLKFGSTSMQAAMRYTRGVQEKFAKPLQGRPWNTVSPRAFSASPLLRIAGQLRRSVRQSLAARGPSAFSKGHRFFGNQFVKLGSASRQRVLGAMKESTKGARGFARALRGGLHPKSWPAAVPFEKRKHTRKYGIDIAQTRIEAFFKKQGQPFKKKGSR